MIRFAPASRPLVTLLEKMKHSVVITARVVDCGTDLS